MVCSLLVCPEYIPEEPDVRVRRVNPIANSQTAILSLQLIYGDAERICRDIIIKQQCYLKKEDDNVRGGERP